MKSLKVLILAAFVSLPVFDRCAAAELRTVGGIEVDLQPLVDWAGHKKGERPLKHWKLVQILEHKRQSTFPVFLCDIEGLKMEIMLKNCPKEVLDLLQQKTALEAKLAAARDEQEAAANNLGGSGNKRQANRAKRTHTAATQIEKAVKKDLADLERKIKQQQKIYAMATGATYAGLSVWDTGLRAH